jgi:heme/copper-type cytochrome/quinol oxidase subunit 4
MTTTVPVRAASRVVLPLSVGAAVAVVLGVYGRVHDPTGVAVNVAGFSGPLSVKAWLATLALVLAVVQLISALALFGHLRALAGQRWVGPLHRWSGRAAVLVTLPVVAHCLYALGFRYDEPRVLVHSLLGCFFYGAFAAKMLTLSRNDLPRWLLPVAGGAVFTGLVGLWLTSSLWFFTTFGIIR